MKSRAIRKIVALVIIAALAVTMAFTLAACNNESGGADIAILVPSADHGWTGAILDNANAWADQINAEGTYSAKVITATDVAAQSAQIEDIAANQNYKAVVILPYSDAVESSLQILANTDIPFIMVDRIVNSVVDDAVATVKGDNYQIGYKTGMRFIEQGLTAGDSVLIVPGDNSTVPITRNEGFFDALATAGLSRSNLKVVDLPNTDWARSKAKESFTSFASRADFGDFDFIFTHDSELSMGIIPASEQRFLFRAGDKVRHPHFGAGVVLDFGGGAYTVEFESGKTRSVSAASDLLIPFYERKS